MHPVTPAVTPAVTIVPATQTHLEHLASHRADNLVMVAEAPTFLAHPAWTVLFDGAVVASAGLVRHTNFWGEAWVATSEDVPRRAWPAITRFCRGTLAQFHAGGVRLIECFVQTDAPAALAWAERCGFVVTGFRPGYLPDGSDVFLMALDPHGRLGLRNVGGQG